MDFHARLPRRVKPLDNLLVAQGIHLRDDARGPALFGVGLLPVTGLFSGTDLTDDISILTVGDYFVEDVDCAR